MNVLRIFAEDIRIDPTQVGIPVVRSAENVLLNTLNTAYFWAGIVCVIVIIIGGYFYVISNGNAANVKRGKDAVTGAVIGLVVVLAAFAITQFVIGRF